MVTQPIATVCSKEPMAFQNTVYVYGKWDVGPYSSCEHGTLSANTNTIIILHNMQPQNPYRP